MAHANVFCPATWIVAAIFNMTQVYPKFVCKLKEDYSSEGYRFLKIEWMVVRVCVNNSDVLKGIPERIIYSVGWMKNPFFMFNNNIKWKSILILLIN